MKKRIIGFIAGCLALTLIVGTWAFYSSDSTVDNRLKTVEGYGDTTTEKFTPDTDWTPGEEVTKELGVTNTGDADLVVRIKLKEDWWKDANSNGTMEAAERMIGFDSTGASGADRTKINYTTTPTQTSATDGDTTGDQTVVKKALSTTKWTLGTDGYWYYTEKLSPNDNTGNLITSITLAGETDMGKQAKAMYWTENATIAAAEPVASNIGTDSTQKWVLYTGPVPSPTVASNEVYTRAISGIDPAHPGYAGAIYDLFITTETCQATSDAVTAAFGAMTATDLDAIKTAWNLPS